MNKTNRAAVEFSLHYTTENDCHTNRIYVDRVDFWRDILPGTIGEQLEKSELNFTVTENFEAGKVVPVYNPQLARTFVRAKFNGDTVPQVGRYYPVGHAWRGFDSFPNTPAPFKLMAESEDTLTGDRNHPLSGLPIQLSAKKLYIHPEAVQRGGSINDIAELISTNGPGMQLPGDFTFQQVYGRDPMNRYNDDDTSFYIQPRMTNHIDTLADKHLTEIHSRILQPGMKILDLMASCHSHFPETLKDTPITGLGMNMEELQENPMLSHHLLHDLNQDQQLPFADASFDAVTCALSIEYLTRPLAVVTEIARILRPGGIVIISLSDRWFPSKEIAFWKDLHPYERMGYVIRLLKTVPALKKLYSESVSGYPRPENDSHYGKTFVSDPVFVVWSQKEQ